MEDEQICGFICEIKEETFKVYAFKEGLFDVPIGDEEPELARWVLVLDAKESDYEMTPDREIPYFTMYEKDGVVHGSILAICPCEYALPQEIGDKFADKVIVRYAPSENHIFEVMELVIWDKDPEESKMAYMHMTPWTAEFMCTHMKPAWEMFKEQFVSTNPTKVVCKDLAAIGICIKHDYPNPTYDPTAYGSQEKCAILWSQQFGLTRWLNKPFMISENEKTTGEQGETGDPIKKLGKWYLYMLNDKRHSDKSHKRAIRNIDQLSWLVTTAKNRIEAPMPKPTHIQVDNDKEEVQVTCNFTFNHAVLEKDDAHFADVDLGRVDVCPQIAAVIIQKIERHHQHLKEMESKKFELLKNEVIIVEGNVALFENFVQRASNYPEQGLFFLKDVTAIFYLQGGKVIWKASDEKVEEAKKEEKDQKEYQKKDQSEEEKATAALKSLVL